MILRSCILAPEAIESVPPDDVRLAENIPRSKVPVVMSRLPATVTLLVSVDETEELAIRLLNGVADEPPTVCVAPLSVTLPLLCVNVPPLLQLPATSKAAGAVTEPALMVKLPPTADVLLNDQP